MPSLVKLPIADGEGAVSRLRCFLTERVPFLRNIVVLGRGDLGFSTDNFEYPAELALDDLDDTEALDALALWANAVEDSLLGTPKPPE